MVKYHIDSRQCMYCGGKFSLANFDGICPNCSVELSVNEILGATEKPIYAVLVPKYMGKVANQSLICRKCGGVFGTWRGFTVVQEVWCQDCFLERE